MRRSAAAIAALAAMSLASVANAAVLVRTFTLDTSGISGVPDANFGTVTVTDNGLNLYIAVALATGLEFRSAPDSNHHALTFKLDKSNAVLSGLTTNVATTTLFQDNPAPFTQSPFGSVWNYAVDCTHATGNGNKAKNGCLPGYTTPPPTGALNPTKIGLRAAGMHLSDLQSVAYRPKTGAPKSIFFGVDVVTSTGKTGNVGASSTGWTQFGYAPEPGAWAMLILGFGCVGADLRRRRARQARLTS